MKAWRKFIVTTEAVYFKKLLDEGKINKEDALAFYMDKCKELEEELKATRKALNEAKKSEKVCTCSTEELDEDSRKALKNLVDLFDGIEFRYR